MSGVDVGEASTSGFDLDEAKRQWDAGNLNVVNDVFEDFFRVRSTLGFRVVQNLTERFAAVTAERDAAVSKLARIEEPFKAGESHQLDDSPPMSSPFDDVELTEWWQRGISYAARFVRAKEAEHQRDAAVAKLTPQIKKLTAVDGEVTMTLSDPYKGLIGRSLRDLVEEVGGPNYVEMSFKEAGRVEPIVVAVARSQVQTPHELRLKAEAERDAALAEVTRLQTLLEVPK